MLELVTDPGRVDLEMVEDRRQIDGREIQQLDEKMLHLHVVVGLRDTEPGRQFESAAADRIQPPDQDLEITRHPTRRCG